MKGLPTILLVSLAAAMAGCRGPGVKLTEMDPPPIATVTDHTVTIKFGVDLLFPKTQVHTKARIQGETLYLWGYRTSRVQNSKCAIHLPASVNPQSISVVWIDPDGRQLRTPIICPFGAAYLNFATNYQATYQETPPTFFWCGSAPANGQKVLRAIRSGDPQAKASARALIGSQVTFVGEGVEHEGPDLETQDGIKISVDLVPFQTVSSGPCGEWGGEVQGKLESIDFSNRVIHIEAGPEHWMVSWRL
jgi:hypothetical protein